MRQSETGESVPVKPQRYEGLAVILVSYGRHGWGAPQSNGQYIPFPASAPKELRIKNENGITFWSPESGAIEYRVVQGKTRTSILDDAYFGCADYFYTEFSKDKWPQGGTHNTSNKSMAPSTLLGARFVKSGSLDQSFNPPPQRPVIPNHHPV